MSKNEILLVDDDADLRILLGSALRMLNYHVESVDGGRAAVDMAERRKFALIIMDWHMPEIDGFEAARLIWEKSRFNQDTKIVVFTSSDTPEEIERCHQHGFSDVLSKSFEMGRLKELMSKHLPRG